MYSKSKYKRLYSSNREYNYYINKKRNKYKNNFINFFQTYRDKTKNTYSNKSQFNYDKENLSFLKLIILLLLIILYIQMIYATYTKYNRVLLNMKLKESIYMEDNYEIYLKKFKKKKKVIYTVNLGKYDTIKNIPKKEGWDYINFVDWEISNEEKMNYNWTFIMIPDFIKTMNISQIKKQRFIKLHPHLFFKDYEISLYIDSIYILFGNVDSLIIRLLPPNINIIANEHRTRNTIRDEINGVLYLKKEKIEMIKKIKERYKSEKFPDNYGLVETSFIIRRHNEKDCVNIMEKWWNEINTYSHRDQLSLCYVLWKENTKIKFIDKNYLFNFLERIPHIKNSTIFKNFLL